MPWIFFRSLVLALVLTILIEYALLLVLVRKDALRLLWYSILINSFTNPLLNFSYNYVFHELYPLEIAVAVIEGILIRYLLETGYKRAFAISFVANLASLLIGLLIFG